MQLLPGYVECEKIYESNASKVFRGLRETDGEAVILKILKGERPAIKDIARYRNEYQCLSSMRIDSVIGVHCLEEYNNTMMLVLEDFGASSLKIISGQRAVNLPDLLDIFIVVAEALSRLHDQCLLHKDVNPSNIVYNPSSRVCKLIDFGLATRLSPGNPGQNQSLSLEGSLAYISPEQTGRLNRQIDYRTDLYSLGATMYELLAGQQPFAGATPIEFIHAHIANTPRPVHEIRPETPMVLSDIVAKLMAKAAEDRYQSAVGLKHDLERCLAMLRDAGRIEPFELAQRDLLNIFYLPQKLYGRGEQIETLRKTFEAHANGLAQAGAILVSGYSGTGKSSLVKEVLRLMARGQGRFIEGKFDQHQRAVPYFAVKQALSGLIDSWLSESAETLDALAVDLRDALGAVGQVLLDMVPGLELILGPQPAVAALSGLEAQNRLNYVCGKFFSRVATAEHPLVMFIDDLQWADLASLNLFATLLADSRLKHFLFIGAYRDNEVSPTHPLRQSLDSLAQKGIVPTDIHIDNLAREDIAELCADALHGTPSRVRELASLIHTKTLGNPFFVTQFLKSLYAAGLIAFDSSLGQWRFDTEEIRRRNIPDDVVVLMADKIQTLSPQTQTVLKLASCVGNAFTLDTLCMIYEATDEDTQKALGQAIHEGLLIARDQRAFKFSHDRIQQACYSLMRDRDAMHHRIGRLLLTHRDPGNKGEDVFEIVNQLNEAKHLIRDANERLELVALNLEAGLRAKNGAAFAAAVKYLLVARELLPGDAWQERYALTFTIHCELARCRHYAGLVEELDALFETLLSRARSTEDAVKVHMIRMMHSHLSGDYRGAVEIQKQALELLGVEILKADIASLLHGELENVGRLLGDRSIEDLEFADTMDSPRHEAIMDILMELWTSAYLDSQLELVAWSSCKMTNISLEYGNNHLTAYGYMNYAFVCMAVLGHYDVGHRMGKVANRLAERFEDLLIRGKAYLIFAVFINHWRQPMATSIEYFYKSLPLLIENGDWTYAGYCVEFLISDPTICGVSCQELHAEAESHIPFLQNNAPVVLDEFFKPACLNPLRQFLGLTKSDKTLDDDDFSEAAFLNNFKNNPLALSYFYTAKLRGLYSFGYLEDALAMFDKADFVASIALAQAKVAETYFYACLTVFGLWQGLPAQDRESYGARVAAYRQQMRVWADNSPANFLHKHLLLEAELARVEGRPWDALVLYESAINEARASGYINNKALAHECCARFLLGQGLKQSASYHMMEARYAYLKWGATAKVRSIERHYAGLTLSADSSAVQATYTRDTLNSSIATRETDEATFSMDIISIIKATQNIASEIDLEKLLITMLEIVMENAGASRAMLLEPDGDLWRITAQRHSGDEARDDFPEASGQALPDLPTGFLNYCARTRKNVTCSLGPNRAVAFHDDYFRGNTTKSAMAIPLVHSGSLKGLLYLENNLVEDAFTPKHLQVLGLLSAQIAISIENAKFYKELGQMVEQRTAELVSVNRQLQVANAQLEQLSTIDGLTQIYNRRSLDAYAEREWKRHIRMGYDFSLVMCDIDYFKRFNDTYGHVEGDRCLRLVAEALKNTVKRPGDFVSRYGGEEFAIILPETDGTGLASVLEELQARVKELWIAHVASGVAAHVSLSFGALHVRPTQGQRIDDAFFTADCALYQAKAQGRNCFVIESRLKNRNT